MASGLGTPVDDRLAALTDWVECTQPQMEVLIEGDAVVACGRYDLRPELPGHPANAVIASYDLKVILSPEVDRSGPRVFEVGGRIPRCDARHVGEDGWCCIGVFPIWRATAQDRRYIAFLNDPLRNFFLGQVAVDEGLDWPFGEYRHGSIGAIEAAADFLGCEATVKAVRQTTRLLPVLRERGTSVSYRSCPCGSRRVLGRCCFRRLHALSLAHDAEVIVAISEEVERQARKIRGMKPNLENVI